ncbi:E3 ubiquitin-protein ligase UPL4-like isoform X5 [Histomonas meleagridis]|uniref:E3 ubiquitin-protein ligase UPL4-like isoform X5 n=1 Tax=Histomonas meleagridis TaxID=135588 RepID=UPI00355954E6|nr:E3 ubiquitin-protein ligase UPL4-like isoform X5 [Histomonas meleagridis]KAH0797584.1 E3 ubiquitin-protein ligase UPL4-like isoform X5 [Histomonas meleagridis]
MDFLGFSLNLESFDVALQLLLSDDEECQMDGLQILSNIFLYGAQEILIILPVEKATVALAKLVSQSNNQELLNLASSCVCNLLEANLNAIKYLASNGYLKGSAVAIKKSSNNQFIQNVIKSYSIFAEYSPRLIGSEIGIDTFLHCFNKLSPIEQKSAAKAMENITNTITSQNDLAHLDAIFKLLSHNNEIVVTSAIKTINNIIQNNDKTKIPLTFVQALIDGVNTFENGNTLVVAVRILVSLSCVNEFAEEMIKRGINFKRLLFEDYKGNTSEIKRLTLNVVVNLLPDIDFPESYWKPMNRTLSGTTKIAKEIQPILLKLLIEESGWETLTLAGLSAIQLVAPFQPSIELFNAMAGLIHTPLFAPFVLMLSKNMPDPTVIFTNGFIPLFKKTKPIDDLKEWYTNSLNNLISKYGALSSLRQRTKKFKTFNDLCKYVMKKDLKPFQFLLFGLMKQTNRFLRQINEIPSSLIPAIKKISSLTNGILNFLPMNSCRDPLQHYTPDVLLSKSLIFDFKTPDETFEKLPVHLDLDFSGIESWYKLNRKVVTNQTIVDYIKTSKYKDIIILEHPEKLYNSQRGLFQRNLKIPNIKSYHFRFNNHDFSAYDFMFHSVARSLQAPEDIVNDLKLELIEGDIPRSKLIVPLSIHKKTLLALKVLSRIHNLLPNVNLHNDKLQSRSLLNMSSLLLTSGFLSPSSQIIYHFPFIFDFEVRKIFFKIIAYDLPYSLPFIDSYFFKVPWNPRLNNMRVKCHLHRNNLFEEGKLMLEVAGPGMLRPDVFFDNEEGIGAGPTQEFFTLFSQELCKKSRKLWRDNSSESSEYCWHELGLFPRPDAPPELFYTIGLLCGKAMLMDMILSIPFNPAFFKLMKGNKISLEEVDPQLKRSLESSDGLLDLPFTYPGIPDLELIPGGKDIEITKENFPEYVEAVKKKTTELTEIMNQFKNGLSKVFQIEAFNLFTEDEICNLIEGEIVRITEKELIENVEISHGYSQNSPQIKMLFDTIAEMNNDQQSMLIKFITGCNRLPIGGLKALNPKLVIAKRVTDDNQNPDDTLPSVMTCSNYFKMPEYSNRETLKERLLYAINEGQGTFLLT